MPFDFAQGRLPVVGGKATGFVFNAGGQRVSEWNATAHTANKGKYYWGGQPVAYYTTASSGLGAGTHFEHQDWLGTERKRTSYNGSMEGTYSSLPWGDGKLSTGADSDANHYAQLDHDPETDTDHAQFRQYSNKQGRFFSPDPYDGSYDASNPQSFNRYVYAMNNPLSYVDPSGLSVVVCDEDGWCFIVSDAEYQAAVNASSGWSAPSVSQLQGSGGSTGYYTISIYDSAGNLVGNAQYMDDGNDSVAGPNGVVSGSSSGVGNGVGNSAPNNALAYISKRASCAGQALMQNKLQTGLDALGLIPGEATIVKSVQLAGAVVAGGYSAYQQNMAGAGLSATGFVLTALNAEKASIGKNLAEAIPFLGQGVSAVAVGYDIFGSKAYKSCMSGAN